MKLGIRAKLLIIFTGVFTLAFIVFSLAFYRQFSDFALKLAKEKLQSDTNSITDSTVTQILSEEVVEMYESGADDSKVRQLYIDIFHDTQAIYPEMELEFQLVMVEPDEQSIVTLLYMNTDGEVDPIEREAIEDAEEWQAWLDSIEESYLYDIYEDEEGLWTDSSAPIFDRDFNPSGAVLDVFVRTDDELATVQREVRNTLLIAVGIGYPILLLVIFLVSTTATRSLKTIINASEALERGDPYNQSWLEKIAKRGDEFGQMARTFDRMAIEVQGREEKLKQEIVKLNIEIDFARQKEEVSQIVETEYFRDLKTKSAQLRAGVSPDADKAAPTTDEKQEDYLANLQKKAQQMREKKDNDTD